MKFYTLFSIFIFNSFGCIFSQTFNKTLGFTNVSLEVVNNLIIQDSIYIFSAIGVVDNNGNNHGEIEIFITNLDGEVINSFETRVDSLAYNALYNSFVKIDNDYIFANVSEKEPFGSNTYWATLTSYDTLLNINWQKTNIGDNSFFRTMQITAEGDFLLLGESGNIGNGFQDVFLMKTDSLGNVKWTKTYGGTEDDTAYSLEILEDGNYLIGARHVYDQYPNMDDWLIKTDTAGNVLWDKYIGDIGADAGIHIFDSHYFHQHKDTLFQHAWDGHYGIDYFGEFDTNGNVLWTQDIKKKENAKIFVAKKLQDGGYLFSLVYSDTVLLGQIAWLIKYDEDRNKVWERFYLTDNALANGLVDMEEDDDGNFVFVGTALRDETVYNSDIWLLKLNSEGCLDATDCGLALGILDLTLAKEVFNIQINPNPVKDRANIVVKNSSGYFGENLVLKIYSANGKEVYQENLKLKGQAPIFSIDCTNWQSGVYYIKASVNGLEYGNGKFVLE